MSALARKRRRADRLAFTLLELVVVLGMIAVLAIIGVPFYRQALDDAENMNAVGELSDIAAAVDQYITRHGHPPDSLADIGLDALRDEWGNPYQYLRIDNLRGKAKAKGGGEVRKDHNIHPINCDYDLYSMGPDGKSVAPLTAQPSRDDIIRAQDGSYIGLASGY